MMMMMMNPQQSYWHVLLYNYILTCIASGKYSAMEVTVKGRFIQSPETNKSRACQKTEVDSPFIFALYMLIN